MKNVEEVFSRIPTFRVQMQGMPRPTGWAVRYVSGMDVPGIEPGYWLSQWYVSGGSDPTATFNFEADLHLCFNPEAEAIAVSAALKQTAEIETEVVNIR